MTEYRTGEQWQEICESAYNGNWQQAGEMCKDYGFYANDMINKYKAEDVHILEEPEDLALLSELATEKRYKENK